MEEKVIVRRTRLSPEQRRREILEAALAVFGEEGYRDGSLQEVASRAGLTVQGLLHYFPSKVDLLLATLDRWQATAAEESFGRSGDALTDVTTVGRHILERNLNHPGVMRLRVTMVAEATSESHPANAHMIDRYRVTFEAWRDMIAADVDRGILKRDVDPVSAAEAMIALLDGLQLQSVLRPEMDLIAAYDSAAAAILPRT